jgi:hypothetical protein
MENQLTETKTVTSLDVLEKTMLQCPQLNCPLVHRFTDGMYIREIFMPAGALVTSLLHKTKHPFVVLRGKLSVWNSGHVEHIEAPHFGITEPGSRRLLVIHEDTTWITFHPTELEDPDEIVESICDLEVNPMLDEADKIHFGFRSKCEITTDEPQKTIEGGSVE